MDARYLLPPCPANTHSNRWLSNCLSDCSCSDQPPAVLAECFEIIGFEVPGKRISAEQTTLVVKIGDAAFGVARTGMAMRSASISTGSRPVRMQPAEGAAARSAS